MLTPTTTAAVVAVPAKIKTKILKQRFSMKKRHDPEICTNPNCLECAVLNIVNPLKYTTHQNTNTLLNKVLSFVPTASNAGPT